MKSLSAPGLPDMPRLADPSHTIEPAFNTSSLRSSALLEYLLILWRRKAVILVCISIALVLAVLVTLKATRLYEATGRLAITRESADVIGLKESNTNDGDFWDYTVALETHVRSLQGDMLALKVIQALGLQFDPYLARIKAAEAKDSNPVPVEGSGLSAAQESDILERFHKSLNVLVIPRTQIIEIRFLHPNPQTAASVVNALANVYIEQNFNTKYDSVTRATNWLSRQLSDLQLKVQSSQEKLVRYQKQVGIYGLDEKQNVVTQKLDQLNKELTEAQADRIKAQADYIALQAGGAEVAAKLDPLSLIEKIRGDQITLQSQYAQETTRFGPAYPRVKELQRQLNAVNTSLAKEVDKAEQRIKNEYLAAQHREAMLTAALEKQKKDQSHLNESAIEFTLLKHDADSNRELYDGLLQKLREAGVRAGLKSNDTRVVEVARVPAKPAQPLLKTNLGLGGLLGLVCGIALALLLEHADSTVRTPEHAQVASGLPALAFIPAFHGKQVNGLRHTMSLTQSSSALVEAGVALMSLEQPGSVIAEAYRALRTALLLSHAGAAPKVILVTSALPRDGKTSTSLNLASVLAQGGARVLLVDADLRRPSVHRTLGIGARPGLNEVLEGESALDSAVSMPRIANLHVMPAGSILNQPAERLGSRAMKALLEECRKKYDHIVLDSPPALLATDPVLLSAEADAVLLVVRAAQTPVRALLHARDRLLGVNANVLGLVVNAVESRELSGYGYSYKEGYGGTYGEGYKAGTKKAAGARQNGNGHHHGGIALVTELQCEDCGVPIPPGSAACENCTREAAAKRTCWQCKSSLPDGAIFFCVSCGANLGNGNGKAGGNGQNGGKGLNGGNGKNGGNRGNGGGGHPSKI
ncbi:MAG TPA: polysaccharide biosynthesis tyrosine autokinase [Candidatus Angelobacter sp.]|nr:polysaccharide biosynthesis tyrosine autokinase [Candidatus Angelobacter sp.]